MRIRLGGLRRIILESLEDGHENVECPACGADYDPRDQVGEPMCPQCGRPANEQPSDDQTRRLELQQNPTGSGEAALEEIVGLMPPDIELEGELADDLAYEGIIAEDSVVFSGESIVYLLDSVEQVLVDELGYDADMSTQGRHDNFRAYARGGLKVFVDEIDTEDRPTIYVSFG